MIRAVRTALLLLTLAASTAAPADVPVLQQAPQLGFGYAGDVFAFVRLPDGSMIVGGTFEQVYDPATDTSTTRRNLARFDASGNLDAGFDPAPSGSVRALALGPDGSLYIGGAFDTIAGERRYNLARLAPDGTLDPDWIPFTNGYVYSLATDATGAVFVGGEYITIGGLLRTRLAKLSGTGAGLGDPDWRQDANGIPWALAVSGTSLYVGGDFTQLASAGGSTTRSHIAKLATSGTGEIDANWNPAANGGVYALAVDAGGVVFAGGGFSFIGGQVRNCCLARLVGATGASDTTWTYGIANSSVFSLVLDANFLYPAGAFTTINGLTRRYVARIAKSFNGLNDAVFDAGVDAFVYTLALDPASQSLYVGGGLRSASGQSASAMVRVGDFTGQLFERKFLEHPGHVTALAPTPDGGTLVGGYFTRATVAGAPAIALSLLKLDAQYARVSWFGSTDGSVRSIVVDAAGNAYVGGLFANANLQPRARLAKFNAAGALDATWNPAADNRVDALALSPGGASVYVAGAFANIGGQQRAGLARLSTSGKGAVDAVWNPAPNGPPSNVMVATNGAVHVAGGFSAIGAQLRSGFARLSDGGAGNADPAWDPSPDGAVEAIAIDADGGIVVGGSFSTIGGLATGPVAKLSPTGGAASVGWGAGLAGSVLALARDSSGSWFAGLSGGAPLGSLVRIAPTGQLDPGWIPAPDGDVDVLAARGAELVAAGRFAIVAGQPRRGLAAFREDVLLRNDFE